MTDELQPRSSAPDEPAVDAVAPAASAFGFANVLPLFTSPAIAFARLAEAPRRAFVGPMILSALLIMVSAWVMLPQILDVSYDAAVAMMEKMNVPEDKLDEALAEIPSEVTPTVLLQNVFSNVISVPFFILIGAGIIHLAARLAGGRTAFSAMLGMFSLAYVIWALGAVVRAGAVVAADSVEVTLGPGALLPGVEFLSPLGIFLDLFDVFSIWHLLVLVVGISVVTGVSRGTAWGVALVYWVLRSLTFVGGKMLMMWARGA